MRVQFAEFLDVRVIGVVAGGDEYLIVEPAKGQKAAALRATLQTSLKKLAEKFNCNFRPRFALNRVEDHVVIYKEAKN